ncbi:hypothetical protein HU200_022695 [Digitaria exilis]|uniref:Uncharacterized protein n=1 Tax=Digitaria exilis TaxID=1010633 RepID=A0A835EV25_9POAL|nr:hypothetical protein HU200_022695 [Digitaria exilis]
MNGELSTRKTTHEATPQLLLYGLALALACNEAGDYSVVVPRKARASQCHLAA